MEKRPANLMPHDVSVIICTYAEDRWTATCAAVESVRSQTVPPREIIVVVDHNAALLKRAREQWPDLSVIENHEPRGLSGSRNTGVAIAQSTWVAFLDDDAVAETSWLEEMMVHGDDPQILGVGAQVKPAWETTRPAWFPEEFLWVVGCSYRGLPEARQPVRNLFGGSMCLKREIFAEVGGFRHGVGRIATRPMGCEETELCIRARQRWPQKIFLYEPQASIQHTVPGSRANWNYFRARCFAEGQSKALVSRSVGARDGLASEWAYTLRVLPQGVLRGLADAFFKHSRMGLARAGAIIAGLMITTAGYILQGMSQRVKTEPLGQTDLKTAARP